MRADIVGGRCYIRGAMNYHRRTTRPDGTFYRENRKIRRSGGRRQQRTPIVPILIAGFAVVAAVAFWMFKH